MLSAIDEILWSLKDGKWHNLKEITENSSLTEPKAKMTINFLQEYSFIQVDENERKAKLRPQMLSFIDEIQRAEKEEASSHKSLESAVSIKEFASLRRSLKKI
jgi:hypothetical protein